MILGYINAHSIVRKGSLIFDIIDSHQLDALAICESFVVNDDPEVIKMDAVPTGFKDVSWSIYTLEVHEQKAAAQASSLSIDLRRHADERFTTSCQICSI